MGVDLTAIVRNDFRWTGDRSAAKTYLRLKYYGVDIFLKNGFWDIETYDHYCQYFNRWEDGRLHVREIVFDVIRMFGVRECWVCDEYHSWNGCTEDMICDFNQWFSFRDLYDIEDGLDGLPIEFDESKIPVFSSWEELDYKTKYHDAFPDLNKRLIKLERRFPDCRIISIGPNKEGQIELVKDGRIQFVTP